MSTSTFGSGRKLGDIVAAEIEAMRRRAEAGPTASSPRPESGQWMRCVGGPPACNGMLVLVAIVYPEPDRPVHVIHPIRPWYDWPNLIQVRPPDLVPVAVESIDLEREGWNRAIIKEAAQWSMDPAARAVLCKLLEGESK